MIWTCSLANSAICGVGDFLQQITVEIRAFSVLTNKQFLIICKRRNLRHGPVHRSGVS